MISKRSGDCKRTVGVGLLNSFSQGSLAYIAFRMEDLSTAVVPETSTC